MVKKKNAGKNNVGDMKLRSGESLNRFYMIQKGEVPMNISVCDVLEIGVQKLQNLKER